MPFWVDHDATSRCTLCLEHMLNIVSAGKCIADCTKLIELTECNENTIGKAKRVTPIAATVNNIELPQITRCDMFQPSTIQVISGVQFPEL
eukprot:12181956-Heterocapsa_arctica.AAC.1